ncbi:helix-turn-helix domain-containing protein [Microbacterium elymi]|uniref:Helix-turn-helix domain-containing protein n=1 Tax=Microbacterium elymi TaxID=2909587 RepID=A0ABY5NMZ7_9MICO|nr:helix-turn-helix domain-containing protein [Microbacterium elymi]UUT36527.1 helix-turn-helix domain-containing protein [Microbacterium elymi]
MPVSATTKPGPVATNVARDVTAFRAAVNESFVPLLVTASRAQRFGGVIRAAGADDVHLTEVQATPHVVERTPQLIARDERAFFKVNLMLAGRGLLVQDGREAVLEPGSLAVYDTSRPYSLVFDDEFRTLVAMFPRHLLRLPTDLVGELTAVRVSGSEGVGAVVGPYLAQLAANLEQFTGAVGARLAHSALDLIATVFSQELGLDDAADPHRALMQRIHTHIDGNLAAELTPASIAAAHFISTRHLHGLFQEQGTTVSTWIRSRRLEQCRRDLTDPLLADRPVAAIAAGWGFADPAHFSRTFKAEYGVAPSEFRASLAT